MAGPERSRRPNRGKRRDSSSDGGEGAGDGPDDAAAAVAAAAGPSETSRETDRLAKIQEKNRKAQQKFRERRKEKMMSMEKQITNLEQLVLQLRTEKDHAQEQLAVEKRINAENAAVREAPASSIASHGLQDYDPIDMSFLPMWQGLQLSNEKIRSMPADTLKMLIQTILQDLRTRLSSLAGEPTGSAAAQTLGGAVSAAFAFLNRCYLVEPIRYRKVVVDILGPTAAAAAAGPEDADAIPLSPDQELRIAAQVEQFDKAMSIIWQARLEALDAMKACRGRRASELDNMRAFLQVHSYVEAIQESLRRENEALVSFLAAIGGILGHMQLTQAMFAATGQDILSFCRSVQARLLLQSSAGGAASALLRQHGGAGGSGGAGVGFGGVAAPHGGLGAAAQWGSYLGGVAGGAGAGGLPLQDAFLMQQSMGGGGGGGGGGVDLDAAAAQLHGKGDALGFEQARRAAAAPPAKRPASPGSRRQSFMHDSPFLYGPDVAGAGVAAPAPFRGGSGAAADFRPAKAAKTEGAPEPGVGALATPADRRDSFLELVRAIDNARGPGGNGGGAAGVAGLPNAAAIAAALSPRNPAEILGTLNQMSSSSVKGLVSLLASQTAQPPAQGASPTQRGVGGAAAAAAAPNTLVSDLEQLLNSKEGSRTLDLLTRDLSVSRTLSAGELMNIPGGPESAGPGSVNPSPRPPSGLMHAPPGPKADAEAAAAVAAAAAPPQAMPPSSQHPPAMPAAAQQGVGAVTSGGSTAEPLRVARASGSAQITSGQRPLDPGPGPQ